MMSDRYPNAPEPDDELTNATIVTPADDGGEGLERGTGLVPSPFDPRDFDAEDLILATQDAGVTRSRGMVRTSQTSDLTNRMPPIWNQAGTSACTSSVADMHVYIDDAFPKYEDPTRVPSHGAQWAWTKLAGGPHNVAKNVGAGIRDSILVTRDRGVVSEATYPWQGGKAGLVLPGPNVEREAEANQTLAFFRLDPTDGTQVLRYLSGLRLPIAFGLGLWDGWVPSKEGVLPRFDSTRKIWGHHLMVVVGHKTLATGVWLKIRNSWGLGWGGRFVAVGQPKADRGHAWMHLDDFTARCFDPYAITSVERGMVSGTNVTPADFRRA